MARNHEKIRAKLNIQLAMFWRNKPHAACKAPANKEQTKATTSTRWAQQIKTANHEKQQRSYVRPCIRSSETNQQWESKSRTKAAIKRKNKKHTITWDNKTRRPANVFIWWRMSKVTFFRNLISGPSFSWLFPFLGAFLLLCGRPWLAEGIPKRAQNGAKIV